jgi:cobalt/nickel transport protein
MRRIGLFGAFLAAVLAFLAARATRAHFQTLIPSTDIVTADGDKTVNLDIIFTHPMECGPAMEMAEPKQFGVLVHGEKTDLMAALQKKKVDGKTAYTACYKVKAPGDHVFYIEPAPYWEPAEGKMIVHYTKVVVDAFGEEQGWDAMVGFPVEIEPLVRPYGLWTGNLFRGVVKKHGKPVPFAELEVEYCNAGEKVGIPSDPFVTQVIKADQNGVFSYAMPRAGWWAFAALIDGAEKMDSPEGKKVDVELGGLIWVRTVDMK